MNLASCPTELVSEVSCDLWKFNLIESISEIQMLALGGKADEI